MVDSISNFLNINANGLETATFTEIRSTLINRYKDLYGTDIDLSTGSADGIFVNDLSLIINNILRTIDILYNNLDVNSASGIYLDRLCALSNVTRKPATYSNASLIVTNNGSDSITLDNTIFIDKSGIEWRYDGTTTLEAGDSQELLVTCTELGPIEAPIDWIYQTVEMLPISVSQPEVANLGTDIESDSELRARRNQSSGAAGTTVLESLTGSLLGVSGIEDVLVYNNNSPETIVSKDNTSIIPHSIYVIIKREAGVQVTDETIGTLIHEKLTPGIQTVLSSGNNGISKSYSYGSGQFGSQIVDSASTVYWKDASSISPSISITINPLNFFTTDEFDTIAKSVMSYLNGFSLSSDLTINDVIIQTTLADPQFKSRPTYIVTNVNLLDSVNPDTFYNYTTYSYTQDGSNYILTLA